jgi:hypothetical protein
MLLFLAVSAAMLMGLAPATAGATDYCVGNTDCGATPVASLGEALALAAQQTNADRVFLDATTYLAPTAAGFAYNESSSPVEIIGKGAGQTDPHRSGGSLVRPEPDRGAWHVGARPDGPDPAGRGRRLHGPHDREQCAAHRLVEDSAQLNARRGVELVNAGKLEDSTVTIGSAETTTAVVLTGGSVRRSALSARTGVETKYGGAIHSSRVTGTSVGVHAGAGATSIRASVIRFSAAYGGGIAAVSGPTTVNANGVTVAGPGTANTTGIAAIADGLIPHPVDVNLSNSIIRGVSTSLYALAMGKTGVATIAASYSDYDPTGNFIGVTNATITEANVSNVGDAGFVDVSNGDYHLLPTSALIDSGDPASPQGLDFDGSPLVADGNGDGIARRDMGAFELQPAPPSPSGPAPTPTDPPGAGGAATADTQPPLITGFTTEPSVFVVASAGTPLAARAPRGTRFRYGLSEPAAVKLTIQRRLAGRRQGARCVRPSPALVRAKRCARYRSVGTLKRSGASGANRIRFTGRIGSRALRPGRYRALITAADTAGNRSTSRSTGFRIAR